MNDKIKEFCTLHKLGKVIEVEQMGNWKDGKRFLVTVKKLRKRVIVLYESNGDILSAWTWGAKREKLA